MFPLFMTPRFYHPGYEKGSGDAAALSNGRFYPEI
jgi:hypothetical protein